MNGGAPYAGSERDTCAEPDDQRLGPSGFVQLVQVTRVLLVFPLSHLDRLEWDSVPTAVQEGLVIGGAVA